MKRPPESLCSTRFVRDRRGDLTICHGGPQARLERRNLPLDALKFNPRSIAASPLPVLRSGEPMDDYGFSRNPARSSLLAARIMAKVA